MIIFVMLKTQFNSVALIKRGGGKCPLKPGNRHVNEMVPSHAKQMLWEMREWMNVILNR